MFVPPGAAFVLCSEWKILETTHQQPYLPKMDVELAQDDEDARTLAHSVIIGRPQRVLFMVGVLTPQPNVWSKHIALEMPSSGRAD